MFRKEHEFHHLLARISQALAHHLPTLRDVPMAEIKGVRLVSRIGLNAVFAQAEKRLRENRPAAGFLVDEAEMLKGQRQSLCHRVGANIRLTKLTPADRRETDVGPVSPGAQDSCGAGFPAEEKEIRPRGALGGENIERIWPNDWRDRPGGLPAGIVTQHLARVLIDRDLTRVAPESIRLFVDEGVPMAELLSEAVARGIETEAG